MKVLGIDYGLKRVGLAVSDPGGVMAFPLVTLVRKGREELFAELCRIVAAEGVELVVLGLPLGMDGSDTLTTRQVRNFAQSLARRLAVPIELVDERLSSVAAMDDLKRAGLARSRQGAALDQQAAVRILETFLGGKGCAT